MYARLLRIPYDVQLIAFRACLQLLARSLLRRLYHLACAYDLAFVDGHRTTWVAGIDGSLLISIDRLHLALFLKLVIVGSGWILIAINEGRGFVRRSLHRYEPFLRVLLLLLRRRQLLRLFWVHDNLLLLIRVRPRFDR